LFSGAEMSRFIDVHEDWVLSKCSP